MGSLAARSLALSIPGYGIPLLRFENKEKIPTLICVRLTEKPKQPVQNIRRLMS